MYLADVPDAFRSPALPAWGCSDDGFYGFPAWGSDPFKVAQHIESEPVESPDFDRSTTPPGFVEGARAYLRDHLGLDPDALPGRVESCMYNLSPTSDFLIDFHPRDARVLVATGGSGHGFKFGSVIGSVVMDRLDGAAGGRWSPIFAWEHVVQAPAPAGSGKARGVMLSTSPTLGMNSAKHLTGVADGAGEILRSAQDDSNPRAHETLGVTT